MKTSIFVDIMDETLAKCHRLSFIDGNILLYLYIFWLIAIFKNSPISNHKTLK